ncbi:oxidoreductase [Ascochyta rabiei]|uniref:cytochrome-b5 reductase n=1 Tax=Didymella rabiei TaxID=5454 RepID=A0A163FQP3_DIDRA|nr:oxidoreductase [Ascochyta rabiei]
MLATPLRYVQPTTVLGGLAIGGASYAFTRTIHAESESPAAARVFSRGPAMVSLPLESSEQVNHNTKLLRFKLPNPTNVSGLPLTSAVLTASWPKGRLLPVARPYTPVSASDEPGKLELLVKQYPNGKQSTHLHSLQPGDTLLFAAALPGRFGHHPGLPACERDFEEPQDETIIALVYAANTDEDVLLRKEFDELQRDFPVRFRVVYATNLFPFLGQTRLVRNVNFLDQLEIEHGSSIKPPE